jgi:hypothetical protein
MHTLFQVSESSRKPCPSVEKAEDTYTFDAMNHFFVSHVYGRKIFTGLKRREALYFGLHIPSLYHNL